MKLTQDTNLQIYYIGPNKKSTTTNNEKNKSIANETIPNHLHINRSLFDIGFISINSPLFSFRPPGGLPKHPNITTSFLKNPLVLIQTHV